MKILKLSNENFRSVLKKSAAVLKRGGVIAHPTDTCYGLAADIFSKKGLKKLYSLKKMSFNKPVSIIVSSKKQAYRYGKFNALAKKSSKKYWPGPLTIIVQRKPLLSRFLNPSSKTIGIRFPEHKFSVSIVKVFGKPITTTSANVTSLKSSYCVKEILAQFKTNKPELIIDGGILNRKTKPSTIADVSSGKIVLIRKGPIKISLNQ